MRAQNFVFSVGTNCKLPPLEMENNVYGNDKCLSEEALVQESIIYHLKKIQEIP